MKKLIGLFVFVIAISVSVQSHAQVFGVKTGLNLSNMLVKDDEETQSDDFELKPGFHAGLTAEFPLTELLSFETGLLLSTKGFKDIGEDTYWGETESYKAKLNLYYLDVPLTAKATIDLGRAGIYGLLGPYIGVGLSGKSKHETDSGDMTVTYEEVVKWGSTKIEDDLKRLDFGLMTGAGVKISSLQIGITYGLGLANISPDTEGGFRVKNRVFGFSVGYSIGG